jgi:hypothetical protein
VAISSGSLDEQFPQLILFIRAGGGLKKYLNRVCSVNRLVFHQAKPPRQQPIYAIMILHSLNDSSDTSWENL